MAVVTLHAQKRYRERFGVPPERSYQAVKKEIDADIRNARKMPPSWLHKRGLWRGEADCLCNQTTRTAWIAVSDDRGRTIVVTVLKVPGRATYKRKKRRHFA